VRPPRLPEPQSRPIVCYVTDSRSLPRGLNLMDAIRGAASCGADWIQIREKHLPARDLLAFATETTVAAQLASAGSPSARVIVNDRLDVALAAGAGGVHLGGESIPVAAAVEWCRSGNSPAAFMVGASCHSLGDALAVEPAGASYIFFGPVFDTPSKRSFGPPQGLDRLSEVCAAVNIPVIAIGGVNEENAASCIRSGASGIAAIRLFQEARDEATLRDFIATLHAVGV